MPRNRLLSICIAVSVALHVAATVAVMLLPGWKRPPSDVVPVELADLPRATDFFEPVPGIVQGGPQPAAPSPVPPTPDPAPAPPRPSKAAGEPPPGPARAESATSAPEPHVDAGQAEPQEQAQEKPSAGSAAEKPDPAAVDPAREKSPPGASPTPPAAPPRPIRDLLPKLGAIVRAPGEPGGRRTASGNGSAVGTEGKPRERGQITEESGGGVHLSSLSSPEFQHQTWYDSVRRKIELVWVYPLEAAQAGIQGEVTIDFTIERNGSVSSIRLVKGSGYKILDDEAIRAIQVVGRARFNPIPKSYDIARLSIRGRFMYIQGGDRAFR